MGKIIENDPEIQRIKSDLQKRELPVIVELKTSVLYAEDAYEVIRYYVKRLTEKPLPWGDYQPSSRLLKLTTGPGSLSKSFFWMYEQDDLYYVVSLAFQKSLLYIGEAVSSPFMEVTESSLINVFIKERRFFGQTINLHGRFNLKDGDLKPNLLVIKGDCVYNINTAPWNSPVEIIDPNNLPGYDVCGRKGHWEESTYWRMYNITQKIWVGEKIIKQYSVDEQPSYQDMIGCMQLTLSNT